MDIFGQLLEPFDPMVDPKSFDFSRILPFATSKVTDSSNLKFQITVEAHFTLGNSPTRKLILSNQYSAIINHILELGRLFSSGSFIDIHPLVIS